MEYEDYYKVMGVERNASQADIKKSYRQLARKYHPDVSKAHDAEKQFKAVNEAYDVLKNPEKRASYDQLGNNWKAGDAFRPPPNWGGNGSSRGGSPFDSNAAGFGDFFDSFFNNQQQKRKGQDQQAKVTIHVEDAYQGTQRSLQLGSPPRTLNVKIPKGIKAGQKIRLTGQGETVRGGLAGDLYLEIEFAPHKLYRVEDRDIYINIPIMPWEAILGGSISIPTLGGIVDLKVPSNSQNGQKMRLKGRGLPSANAYKNGDFYVVLNIVLPKIDNDDDRDYFKQMAARFPSNPRAELFD